MIGKSFFSFYHFFDVGLTCEPWEFVSIFNFAGDNNNNTKKRKCIK
jgi:hypothetical protein